MMRIAVNPQRVKLFREKLKRFMQEDAREVLEDHALREKMIGLRAFSISGDIRVVYKENPKSIILVDIGSHEEVYR